MASNLSAAPPIFGSCLCGSCRFRTGDVTWRSLQKAFFSPFCLKFFQGGFQVELGLMTSYVDIHGLCQAVPIMLDIIPDPSNTFIGLLDLPERCSIATVPCTLELWWNHRIQQWTTTSSGDLRMVCKAKVPTDEWCSLPEPWLHVIFCIYYVYIYILYTY